MTGALEISRINHDDVVLAVVFSADGRYFAMAGLDATARVWAVDSGQDVLCVNHEDIIVAIAFSADGRYFATASEDSTTQVWEVETGRRIACLIHEDSVCDVAFSPDGKRLVTTTGSKVFPHSVYTTSTVTVWDITTARRIMGITHQHGVKAFAFSPTGKHTAIASLDGVLRVWAANESQQGIAQAYEDEVHSQLTFASNRENLAKVTPAGGTYMWQANNSSPVMCIIHNSPIIAIAFSPDAQHLATVDLDDTVHVWEITSGLEIAHLTHEQQINAVAFSPDGKYLATASDDQTARVLDINSSREISCLTFNDKVNAITFSPSGKLLATATGDLMSRRQDVGVRLWLWQLEDVVSGII